MLTMFTELTHALPGLLTAWRLAIYTCHVATTLFLFRDLCDSLSGFLVWRGGAWGGSYAVGRVAGPSTNAGPAPAREHAPRSPMTAAAPQKDADAKQVEIVVLGLRLARGAGHADVEHAFSDFCAQRLGIGGVGSRCLRRVESRRGRERVHLLLAAGDWAAVAAAKRRLPGSNCGVSIELPRSIAELRAARLARNLVHAQEATRLAFSTDDRSLPAAMAAAAAPTPAAADAVVQDSVEVAQQLEAAEDVVQPTATEVTAVSAAAVAPQAATTAATADAAPSRPGPNADGEWQAEAIVAEKWSRVWNEEGRRLKYYQVKFVGYEEPEWTHCSNVSQDLVDAWRHGGGCGAACGSGDSAAAVTAPAKSTADSQRRTATKSGGARGANQVSASQVRRSARVTARAAGV